MSAAAGEGARSAAMGLVDLGFGGDIVPFHGIAHGFDAEDDAAILEDADGAGGF